LNRAIPTGWSLSKLGDLALEVRNGISAKPDGDSGTRILRISAVRPMALNTGDTRFLQGAASAWEAYRLRADDLLFTRYNGNPSLVGVCGRVAAATQDLLVYPDKLIRVRLDTQLALPSFVERAVHVGESRAFIDGKTKTSAGQVGISGADLKDVPIRLPPINEQRRIVTKLEALQSRSRRAREALERIGELEHRLVRRWTHPSFPSVPLEGHLVQKTAEVGSAWRDHELVGLSNEGRIIRRREAIGAKTAHRCRIVMPGDIVFNPIRFSIGSIARYRGKSPVIVSPEYQVISTRPTLSSELIVRFLRSSVGKSSLDTETTGSVRYRVYFKDLQKICVPLAPPSDQAKAERLLAQLVLLHETATVLFRSLASLDASILGRAFTGRLVPQEPGDPPAVSRGPIGGNRKGNNAEA
jgi:hypothetical protein